MLSPSAKRTHSEAGAANDGWKPESERTPWQSVVWMTGCVILILAAYMIEHLAEAPQGYMALYKSCVMEAKSAQNCARTIDSLRMAEDSIAHTILEAITECMKAVGIAVLMSIIVSTIFERGARDRLNKVLAYKIKQISTNVFDAIFGNSHSPAALEAIKAVLSVPIIRPSLSVTYTFSQWSPSEEDLYLTGSYIKIDAVLDAVTRNISDPNLTPSADYVMPIGVSLPNPLHSSLKEHVHVKSLKIDSVEIDKKSMDKANNQLQTGLQDNLKPDAYVEFCSRSISPGQDVRVQANYTMIKELSDTEVLRSFHMTQSIKLTVIDRTGLNLEIHARALHSKDLERTGNDDSFISWELNDVILPQQGIMVWWKKPLASPSV